MVRLSSSCWCLVFCTCLVSLEVSRVPVGGLPSSLVLASISVFLAVCLLLGVMSPTLRLLVGVLSPSLVACLLLLLLLGVLRPF